PLPTATPVPVAPTPVPLPASTPIIIFQTPNVADTVERVRPAVVSLLVEVVGLDIFGIPQSSFGSGSGVIFDPSGLVLTNNHVVQGANSVTVTMDDGTQVPATILGTDRLTDLAVLQLPEDHTYPFVPLNKDVSLRVGDWAIAIGNALALPGGPTVTVGVVSALGRSLEVSPEVTLYDLIQTDTVINPGNSGGPLLNLEGELVGINTAVLRTGASGPVEGIGFAINMETAALVSEQLFELGRVRWAWMGAFLDDLVPEVAARVRLPIRQGVIIQDVVPGGPSEEAGIQPGDIILSMDGHQVATVQELTRLLRQEFRASQEIDVVLFRDLATVAIRMQLGERPR
ncbi:MAG: S1C family serine protease, partial [Dehalococcoidia bacterium]